MAAPTVRYSFRELKYAWFCDCCNDINFELVDGTEVVVDMTNEQVERFIRSYCEHDIELDTLNVLIDQLREYRDKKQERLDRAHAAMASKSGGLQITTMGEE